MAGADFDLNFSPTSNSGSSAFNSPPRVVESHASKREISAVHHTRKGLSRPLALKGIDGVSLDASSGNVTIALPEVGAKTPAGRDLAGVRAELTFALSNVPRMEKTDACCRAFAVLFVWTTDDSAGGEMQPHGEWEEYGRTETVQHGTRPDFTRSFVMDLVGKGGGGQRCCLKVYSRISTNPRLSEQQLLGSHEFTLTELFHVPGMREVRKLRASEEDETINGDLVVQMTPLEVDDKAVSVAVSGLNFRVGEEFHKDKASLLDLFFILWRGGENGDITNVEATYRSEVCWQTDVPKWKPVELSLHRLCAGDLDHEVVVEVFDWDNMGDHVLLGKVHMTARALVNSKLADEMTIAPPDGGAPGLPPGRLVITGDLRSQVMLDPQETEAPEGVYYCDVGDGAKLEDTRFLASMLANDDVRRSNLREVVDDGMRAVAERDFFMNAFLKNRAGVQAAPSEGAKGLPTTSKLGETFAKPFDPTALLPTDMEDGESQLKALEAGPAQAQQRSKRGTPSMLTRPSPVKIRHSFCPSPVDFTASQVLATSTNASSARYVDSRRLSQKYKRVPRHLRGRMPEGKDRDGKLFNILFPRHRYGEMHDMHDEVGDMLRMSLGRRR